MLNIAELKESAEYALRIMRLLEKLPANRMIEVMAVTQAFVAIEAQRALRPQPPEVEDE